MELVNDVPNVTPSEDDIVALLVEALKQNPDKLSQLIKKYNTKQDPAVKKEKVSVYREAIHVITCEHCGSTTNKHIGLLPHETTSVCNEKGERIEITYHTLEQSVYLYSSTSCCDYCQRYIENMDRYDLEDAYMRLLKACTIKQLLQSRR